MDAKQRKRIFWLASQAHLDLEDLRDMAAEINGKRSLSSLNKKQAGILEGHLRTKLNQIRKLKPPYHGKMRPDDHPWDYDLTGKWSQMDLLFDYMLKLGWQIWDLRAWIRRYFHVDHEGWLWKSKLSKAIEGLKAMYKRKLEEEKHGQAIN